MSINAGVRIAETLIEALRELRDRGEVQIMDDDLLSRAEQALAMMGIWGGRWRDRSNGEHWDLYVIMPDLTEKKLLDYVSRDLSLYVEYVGYRGKRA